MLTVSLLVLICALVAAIASVLNKSPLWVAVFLLIVWALLQQLPR